MQPICILNCITTYRLYSKLWIILLRFQLSKHLKLILLFHFNKGNSISKMLHHFSPYFICNPCFSSRFLPIWQA